MELNIPKFQTIRQTARAGVLSEYTLRAMEHEGRLPCVYSGKKCLVNVTALVEQLESESRAHIRET